MLLSSGIGGSTPAIIGSSGRDQVARRSRRAGLRRARHHHHHHHNRQPPRGSLLPRRTSEHWYDDELEYDAVREILDRKRVVIAELAPSGGGAATSAAALPKHRYAVAFCSDQASEAAAEVWDALGRAGPPLFLKVRKRAALTELDEEEGAASAAGSASAASAAAEAFWSELAAQNWRTELDYGLGSGGEDEEAASSPSAPAREEPVLVLVRTAAAARALAAHAAGDAAAVAGRSGAVLVEIGLEGWNQGPDPEEHVPLGDDWKACLRPVVL